MNENIFKKIKNLIIQNNFEAAEQVISVYEQKISCDFDLLNIKVLISIQKNELDQAYYFAKQAIEKNRLNLDANLNMAFVCEIQGKWLESYTYYSRLFALQENFKEEVLNKDEIVSIIDRIIEKMAENLKGLQGEAYQKYYNDINAVNQPEMDLLTNLYMENNDMDYYFGMHHLYGSDYFMARYDDWYHSYWRPDKGLSSIQSKGELIKVRHYGTEYTYDEESPCIVSCIINTEPNLSKVVFTNQNQVESTIYDTIINTFSYFKLEGKTNIKADKPMVFGEPVLLKQSEKNKKLVLNIFIDSFNYQFLKENPLQEVMPYTHKFFGNGIVCSNAYAGSEFTYPSVATYWTGMRPNHHKMLNSNVQFDIPQDIKLLPEYFKEAGYFTAKIGGNETVAPNYGYIRGIDRLVYERSAQNFNVQQAVCDAVEHIEAYKDTDQFVWLDIIDLHDVAGGWQRPISIQTKVPYAAREIDNVGGSSLYQTYSPNKREIYREELKRIDRYLHMLYQYIEDNYNRDEVVISLFSDHGNGFNIENGQPFLSDQRMNIPIMFYCDWQGEHECKEIVESIDYCSILCKLAGVDMNSEKAVDGQVPVFLGGDRKKEYAVSQSIFPLKPYVVSIFNENQKFYLETENNSGNDCRIDFSKFNYVLVDKEDKVIQDEEMVRKNLCIISELIKDFNMYK